ncbi:unnamed protein product [Paramecium sonneborni]|uniref:Transmembrane protein n=1 Tax=Paramecium sonneborni TaxID=65129 RepID=A0A8S1PF17_9CILI|nr:unnamed protein product [Paramecium sonneborni]
MIFQCLIVLILFRLLRNVKSNQSQIIGLLIYQQECKTCKQFLFCQLCHHCETIVLHIQFLEICLDQDSIKLLKKTVGVFSTKIIAQVIIQTYTAIIIEKSMPFYTAILAIIISILFINLVLFLLIILLSWKVYCQIKIKHQIQTPPDGFRIIEQQEDKCLEITNKKDEQKNPTHQQEIEDKGSVNISINEDISPAMLQLKSSLTPSPGRYRSGKILDFLEKKLSHAKLSQKELHYGQSKEYIKKNNTNQALQISIDFGDQENIQSQNKIEIEINNHNFFKQTKFIS